MNLVCKGHLHNWEFLRIPRNSQKTGNSVCKGGSRIWAENLGKYVTVRDVCHKIELETNNLILLCRHSTILKHHAWLWMLCAISMVTRIFVSGL